MATIDVTENQLLQAVGDWVTALLPGVTVVAGQQNRIPSPYPDFIVLTPILARGLSQNRELWPGSFPSGKHINTRSTEWHCQIDVYGPNGQSNATLLATMVKTDWSCMFLKANAPFEFQPLYATDPRNMDFVNAEQQYEIRYFFEFIAQYNPVVTVTLDYFNAVDLTLKEVDTEFPPTEPKQ